MATKTDERARVWAAILYPESLPERFTEIIEGWSVPALLSPLHDLDVNPDGETKKAHFHLMMMFQGKKSAAQVAELLSPLCCTIPQKVTDTRAMARYLCHLDNPSKAQYSRDAVLCFGGADYIALTSSAADRRELIREMTRFCEEQGILYFNDLWTYAMENNAAWFDSLSENSAYCMSAYLKSKGAKLKALEED